MKTTYKDSGVDIEKADALVDWLKTLPAVGRHKDCLVDGIGGFSSLFRIPQLNFEDPCLVSSTDGVGTKLKVAIEFQKFDGLGQDLVAMCVNDLVCCGAIPLFFLDYYATGALEFDTAKSFLAGLHKACEVAGVSLIGGETAEMPGMYRDGDFDCAGFSVGIVDRKKSLGRHRVSLGNRVIGIESSGFHSNGYSLLRNVLSEEMEQWAEELLKPTRLYSRLMMDLQVMFPEALRSAAHITGGGISNIDRVIPKGTKVSNLNWSWPEQFKLIQDRSSMTDEEMLNTLNCGVGFVLIVDENHADSIVSKCEEMKFKTFDLGQIEGA